MDGHEDTERVYWRGADVYQCLEILSINVRRLCTHIYTDSGTTSGIQIR